MKAYMVLGLLLCLCHSETDVPLSLKVNLKEASIGPIRLGDSVTKLIHHIGKPDDVYEQATLDGGKSTQLMYNDYNTLFVVQDEHVVSFTFGMVSKRPSMLSMEPPLEKAGRVEVIELFGMPSGEYLRERYYNMNYRRGDMCTSIGVNMDSGYVGAIHLISRHLHPATNVEGELIQECA